MAIPGYLWLYFGVSVAGTVIAWCIVAINKRDDDEG
jgi:hypothetical protein